MLQCVAVCCIVLQCDAAGMRLVKCAYVVRCVPVCWAESETHTHTHTLKYACAGVSYRFVLLLCFVVCYSALECVAWCIAGAS